MKLLLAASTGGHLEQLHRLAPGLGASPESMWVTFDSPQSRSLLQGRRSIFVPYVAPRDVVGVMRTFERTRRLLATESFEGAVSTGAAMAVGVLLAARLRGIPTTYIESVSRVDGPSLTGRLVAATRLADLRTQHPALRTRRWKYEGNVLQAYRSEPIAAPQSPTRLFVTLGTIRPYRFDAAVDAVLGTGLANGSTTWQLGATTRDDLPGESYAQLPADEFENRARSADVVVTHAGVGTLLQLLEWGIHPVVLIRRASRREHVDDHQVQIGRLLAGAGLAEVVEPHELTVAHLHAAAGRRNVAASGDRGDL